MTLEFIAKLESTGLADKLVVEDEGKREVMDDSKVFRLRNWVNDGSIY